MKKQASITEYLIKFDPRLKGWISYRIEKAIGRKSEVLDRTVITTAKAMPHLAARSLARFLKLEHHAD